ncbi:core-binding factor subunit beta [Cyanistes caeruleus]|nr:core-binding factor subunit beta [Cyanistes caeruleus]
MPAHGSGHKPGGVHHSPAGVKGSIFQEERQCQLPSSRDLAKPGIPSSLALLLRAGVLPPIPSDVDSLVCAKGWVPTVVPTPWSPRGRGGGTQSAQGNKQIQREQTAAAQPGRLLVRSAAPLSPGLAPPDCAPCSPQIKYTGFRDRPHEERQARFQNACRDGRSEIAFVATGTNLSLQFFPASWQGEQRQTPTREYVDFEREGGKVYLKAPMILNGVCVIWKGWIDLQRLDGMGCLEFDEERAQQEDALAQQAFEEARRRTREFEDRDRSHREEMEARRQQDPSPGSNLGSGDDLKLR